MITSITDVIHKNLQQVLQESYNKRGLYRKCNNTFICVIGFSNDNLIGKTPTYVHYIELEHPNVDYTMGYTEFTKCGEEVLGRPDNVLKQEQLYVPVNNFDSPLKEITTKDLIQELSERFDSPLQDLDYEGFNSKVYCAEYVVGEPVEERTDYTHNVTFPKGVTNLIGVYDTYKKALEERHKHLGNDKLRVFRRVWVEAEK